MKLTPSQELALNLSKHTAIIANAGSGKTAVLVERYLKILEENPELHPRNVVAITFTDASARDLKKKIVLALQERIQSSTDSRKLDRYHQLKRQISNANISTIHSFCIQLLRTYPVEANVDASFTILTSPEDQLLREECVRSSFYEILKKAYDDAYSKESELLPVFRLFGRRKITSLIHSFLNSRFQLSELLNSLYLKDDDDIYHFWNDKINNVLEIEILRNIHISFFQRLLQENTKQGTNRANAESTLSLFLSANTTGDKLKTYVDLIKAFFTQQYELNGRIFSKDIKQSYGQEAEQITAPFIKHVNLLEAYVEFVKAPASTYLYLDYSRQLLAVYTSVVHKYTEQKLQYSFLDYDDVIEYALRLVQLPEIQAELLKRFSHILIDEYQDTDAAQYAIAKSLTGNFHGDNRLTIVGDPKQSIYSFRNTDLELYEDTINEISIAHVDNSPVVLSETFRILSQPLAFINLVSSFLFDGDQADRNTYEYTPLVEGRIETKTGTVEIILPSESIENDTSQDYENRDGNDDDDISGDEVTLIALKIRQIITNSSGQYTVTEKVGNTAAFKSPQYSDIAILLRSRSHQSEIETAFRIQHIPFVTYGGKGFYSRPEIIDITNYLRFLVNTNDDIALAGLLRSPYFGLSDIDLYRLSPEMNSKTNLWQRLALYIPQINDKQIIHAYEQLRENLQIVGRVSTQFILQKIIKESGILGILQPMPDGEQKIANLEKYTLFAQSFGKEGYSGTFDFIERITILMERDEAEAQAEPQNELNAVHIMTIHNAKGLEFPIVFLPYLHSKIISTDRRNIWYSLDKELGLGFELPERQKMEPIVELMKIRSTDKQIEEEKRVFYVAMSRARDHLILSASFKKSLKNTRMEWILSSLGIDNIAEDILNITFGTTIKYYRSEKYSTDSITLNIPIIRNITDLELSDELSTQKFLQPSDHVFLLQNIEPSESIGRYSPSQLLTYLECPTKYYLRYNLGLPEEYRLPYYNEADTHAENVQGSLFGQILHKVMEKAGHFISSHFIDLELLDNTFQLVCSDLHLSDEERKLYRERVIKDVHNVCSNEIGIIALRTARHQTEQQFRAMLENGQMLSGIIDRIFIDDQGIWNVLDYKTDAKENLTKNKRYEFQLHFYAYLVYLLYKQEIVKAHILYTYSGQSVSYTFTKNDFESLGLKLDSLISEIRSLKRIRSLNEIERRLNHCPECHYYDTATNVCIAGLGITPVTFQSELFIEQ